MRATYDAYSGAWFGTWPKPGDFLDIESANALMDVYEQVSDIEDQYNFVYGLMDYIPEVDKERSGRRQQFLAFLWELLDVDISQGVAKWQSAA